MIGEMVDVELTPGPVFILSTFSYIPECPPPSLGSGGVTRRGDEVGLPWVGIRSRWEAWLLKSRRAKSQEVLAAQWT